MTFDDRVRALEPLGFSERQTRFLVTVALHSGFCLRRHYMAFAGLNTAPGSDTFSTGSSRESSPGDSPFAPTAATSTTCTTRPSSPPSGRTTTGIVDARAPR